MPCHRCSTPRSPLGAPPSRDAEEPLGVGQQEEPAAIFRRPIHLHLRHRRGRVAYLKEINYIVYTCVHVIDMNIDNLEPA